MRHEPMFCAKEGILTLPISSTIGPAFPRPPSCGVRRDLRVDRLPSVGEVGPSFGAKNLLADNMSQHNQYGHWYAYACMHAPEC